MRLFVFALGAAALIALIRFAGADAVLDGLGRLGIGGLAIVVAAHLPVLVLLGWAFRLAAGGGRFAAFFAARLVRDAGAELLPFSQFGGFAAGVRVLTLSGTGVASGSAAMFADLIAEFVAKLPYTVAGLAVLFVIRPDSPLVRPLGLGLLVLTVAGAVAYAGRAWLKRWFEAVTRRWLTQGLPRTFIAPSFAVHTAAWFAGALESWIALVLLGRSVGIGEALVIDSLTSGLRTFAFFIPAAAGVQEAAYVLASAAVGIGPAPALALSLVRRARDIVIGLPALALWHGWEMRRLPGS
jgi:hypothetical protein